MNNKAVVGVIGAGVLVAAAYAGATVWSGKTAQARYGEQIRQAQARMPFLQIGEQTYRKGLLSSTSTTTLRLGCAKPTDAQAPSLTVTSTIRHGPLVGGALAAAVIDSQLSLAGAPFDIISVAFKGVPLTVHTVVDFAGRTSSTFASPPAKMAIGDPPGGQIDWLGLSGSLESSPDGRAVSYRFKSPGLSLKEPTTKATLRLGNLAYEGKGQASNDTALITVGTSAATLDTLEISDGGVDPMQAVFSGVKIAADTGLDGGLLRGTGTMSGTGRVGTMKIDRFEVQTSMKRLHAATYQRLMETVSREIDRCDGGDRMVGLMALQDTMKALMALMRYGLDMALDKLVIQSGGQSGEFAYGFGIDAVSEAESKLELLPLLMSHAHLRASGRLPVEWLRKLSQAGAARLPGQAPPPASVDLMLEQAEAAGYAVRDGDYVKSDLQFAKGVLTVNGKAVGSRPGAP